MKKMLVLLIALLLAGCAAVVRIDGDQVVNNRLAVKLPDAWNKLTLRNQPFEMWTQEGVTLDHLRFWAGIAPGQALITVPRPPAGQKPLRVPTFTANMSRDQLVSLFELLYATDGSAVKVTKVEPARFAGENGVRFEFAVTRKSNDLQLLGVGWAAVRNEQLYAATFLAPRLSFYKRLLPRAEGVVASARILKS